MTEKVLNLILELTKEIKVILKEEFEKSIPKVMIQDGENYVPVKKDIYIGTKQPEVDCIFVQMPEPEPVGPEHLIKKVHEFPEPKFFATENENMRDTFDPVSVKDHKFWAYGRFRDIDPPTADVSNLITWGSGGNAYIRLSTGILNRDPNKLRTYMRAFEGGVLLTNNVSEKDYIGKDEAFDALIRYDGSTRLFELFVDDFTTPHRSQVVNEHVDFNIENITLMGATPGASSRGAVGYVEKFSYGILAADKDFPSMGSILS